MNTLATPPVMPAPPLAPDAVAEVQRQFLIAETVTPGRLPHLQHGVCLLPDDLDVRRLRLAMALLDEIHDAMRTSFHRGGEWHAYMRRVAPEGGLALQEHERTESEQNLFLLLREPQHLDALHPPIPAFDHRPLGRASLLHGADGGHVLVLSMHHLVFDGISAALYCRQLVSLYLAADPAREAAHLRARVTPYGQFIGLQHEQLFGPGRASLHDWWREALGDLHIDPTPLQPEAQAGAPAHRSSVPLDADLTRRATEFAARHGFTLHLVLMACLQWALHARRGDADVLTLTPTANRPAAFAQTLGCFMNPVVVRQRITPDASRMEALTRLRSVAAGAYRHAALPIGHVVRELCPQLLASQVPLWRSWLSIQVPSVDMRVPAGLRFSLYNLPQGRTAGKGVSLELLGQGNGLEGVFLANASVPAAEQVPAMFLRALDALLAHPDRSLCTLLDTLP